MTSPLTSSLSRRSALSVLASAAGLPLVVAPAASAAGSLPTPSDTPPMGAIRNMADMIRELHKLERTTRGEVRVTTLAEIGTAESRPEQGRELYVAVVGHGPRHVWLQGRIHGNEPYGLDATLDVLATLGGNGSATYRRMREEFTVHVIPMYNPDGSEANSRTTTLWDRTADSPLLDERGRPRTVDLNRDWGVGRFEARESRAWYEYWTMVKPEFALDIHHQGLKQDWETGEDVTLSLGVSLAPGGPTLPNVRGGEYDRLARQMAGHVWLATRHRGHIATDRYDVGENTVIDIRGGVVSAMMLGLDWNGLNPTGHSNVAIFFETSGNTRDGSIGQKARGKLVQQNILAVTAALDGMATGAVRATDPEVWEQIPHTPVQYYFTDYAGIIPA